MFLSPKEENMILTHTYYNKFHGFVCELLGDNQYQNQSNNYTTTFICGGKSIDKGIVFTKNDVYFILFYRGITKVITDNFLFTSRLSSWGIFLCIWLLFINRNIISNNLIKLYDE